MLHTERNFLACNIKKLHAWEVGPGDKPRLGSHLCNSYVKLVTYLIKPGSQYVALNFASDDYIESTQNFSICRLKATRRNAGIEFESILAIGCVINACVARPLRHIVNQALVYRLPTTRVKYNRLYHRPQYDNNTWYGYSAIQL